MEQKLHRYGGRELGNPRPIALRQCTSAAEADAVYALQNEVRAAMPDPELFVPDTREHIGNYLKYDLCVGAWDGERLAAYLILRYCGRTEENYAAYFDLPPEEWDHWANADSAVVHPDYRGNGLQRKMLQAALPLLRPGIVGLGATVSPANAYSLNNALASGFVIVCRRAMYGGHDRYLLRKIL